MLARDRALAVAKALAGWERRDVPLAVALADSLDGALATRQVALHLPSERALAVALHVGRGTVSAAYEILRERRILERERGSGTVAAAMPAHAVCDDPLACVRAFFAETAT